MTAPTVLSYIAAYFSLIVAAAVLLRCRRSTVQWIFAAGMSLIAVEETFRGFSYAAILPEDVVYWRKWVIVLSVLVQPLWIAFSMSYARVNSASLVAKWKWPLAAVGLISSAFVAVFADSIFGPGIYQPEPGSWFIPL